MYLPTDLATIFTLYAERVRTTRDFWSGPIMADADQDVCRRATAEYAGRLSMMNELIASL